MEIAKLAGEMDVEGRKTVRGWGLSDSIALATAKKCEGCNWRQTLR